MDTRKYVCGGIPTIQWNFLYITAVLLEVDFQHTKEMVRADLKLEILDAPEEVLDKYHEGIRYRTGKSPLNRAQAWIPR